MQTAVPTRLDLYTVYKKWGHYSCSALKMNSFAKNHENNDGHGSLLVLTLRWYCSLQIEKMTKMVIGGSQLITG